MPIESANQFPLPSMPLPTSPATVSDSAFQREEAGSRLRHAVRKTLDEAPPAVEDAMARADVESPDAGALPPTETLERRNKETLLLGASRQLERALEPCGEALPGALEHVEGLVADTPSPQPDKMQALIESARSACAAAVNGSGTEHPVTEALQDVNNTGRNDNVGDDIAPEYGEGVVASAEGETQEIIVPDEVLRELESLQSGNTGLPDDATKEDMQDARARLDEFLTLVPDTPAASQPVRRALMEKLLQMDLAISSRTRLNAALTALANAASRPLEERALQLNAGLRGILLQFREQAEASDQSSSPARPEATEASNILEQRGYISPRDARVLEDALGRAVEEGLAEFARGSDVLSGLKREDLHGLGKLCLDAGLDVMEMGRTLADCLRNIPGGEAARPALLKAALEGMAEGPDASRLQYVDMLFQGAYPERSDAALLLKRAVVSPKNREGVDYQHELVQSLHVIQHDILEAGRVSGEWGVGHGRTGAIGRAAGSSSARSFLLTPELVMALNDHGKVAIPDLNYHIAHVALLQAAAESYGLLNVGGMTNAVPDAKNPDGPGTTNAEPAPLKLDRFGDWCRSLGLDAETVSYASGVAAHLENPETEGETTARLLEAGERFNKGLKGASTLDSVGRLVMDTAFMSALSGNDRHLRAMFRTSPAFLAREVLDKHIINLTGLIDANERLDAEGTGLDLDYDKVDAAMREQVEKLKASHTGGLDGGEVQRTLQEALRARAETLHGLRRRRATFINSAETLQKFAKITGESLELRAKNVERRAALEKASAKKALLKFTWPHQRREREAVCRDVAKLAEVLQRIGADNPDVAMNDERHALVAERDRLLAGLADVDPRTMRHTAKTGSGVPEPEAFIETVLPVLLPRAKAVLYFADGQAEADQKAIRQDMATLEKHQLAIFSIAGQAEKVFGSNIIRRLETTVVAALLKTFVDGGADIASFNVQESDTLKAIKAQLKTWGLDADEGIMAGLVPMVLGNMTTGKGRIHMARLGQERRHVGLALAGKAARGEKAKALREDGKNRFAARRAASRIASGGERLREAFRVEGVRGLLAGISRPGQGFVYDKTRGLTLDSGSLFSPFGSNLIAKLDLSHPLTGKLEALHGDSLAVSNLGDGAYQVLLKGHSAINMAAALNIPLAAGFNVKVGAGGGGEGSQGVALRFSGAEDCGAFLKAFMNPESGLANPADKGDQARARELWLKADQIRFVNGREVSANAVLAASHALFSQKLIAAKSLALTGTVSLAFSGAVRQTLEENTQGETAIFECSGSVRFGLGLGLSMKDGRKATMSNINPLSGSVGTEFEALQRFRVSTGPKGLMPDTCMELECGRGEHLALRRLGVLLPEDARARILEEPELNDKLQRILQKAPPTARLVAHYDLKPDVLEELRSRFIEARRAGEGEGKAILADIHTRLKDRESYELSRISVRTSKPSPISRSYSPGMGHMQLVRSNTMRNMDAVNIELRPATV